MYKYMEFTKASNSEVEAILSAIRKNHKNVSIYLGQKGDIEAHPAIKTGSIKLDRALGIGGYAVGRMIEIWGPESSGKTTLTLHAIANCQKQGGRAAFIDVEHALDIGYAQSLGIDLDELLLHQPDYAEMGLDIVDNLASSGIVDLIVIDSVAALVPKAELEGEMGDASVGTMARLMSKACRKLAGACYKNNVTIIWVNQIRYKIGVMFGNPETTSGGNALKFYASQRLDIRRTGSVTQDDVVIANSTKVTVKKNKMAPPFKQVEFDIEFGIGINTYLELLDLAIETGVVQKAGSWYSYGTERLSQGKSNAVNRFRNEPKLFDTIKTEVMQKISLDNHTVDEDNHGPKAEVVQKETITSEVSDTVQGT